jgi:hypothetical protein
VRSESSALSCASAPSAASLYTLLAEEAPECSERGETKRTAQKETLDDDREALMPGMFDG